MGSKQSEGTKEANSDREPDRFSNRLENIGWIWFPTPPHKKTPSPLGLMRLVKKVLFKDQRTFEVWYRLPQFPGVRILTDLVPRTGLEPVLPA